MIIGILGVAGAGKDTCADFLVKTGAFVKVSLADPLKRLARDMFEFTDEQLWGPSAMRNAPDPRYARGHTWSSVTGAGPCVCTCCGAEPDGTTCRLTPRYALQQLGTEFGRHLYPPIWTEIALRAAAKIDKEGGYNYSARGGLEPLPGPAGGPLWNTSVVVPDLRFKNELTAFRDAGAKIIRVVRPGAGLSTGGGHVSETEQRDLPDELFDAVIVNDGTLDALKQKVLEFVWEIGNTK